MYDNLSRYDVFHTSFLANAEYDGALELPIIAPSNHIPERLIPFSHARAARGDIGGACIHFFEHDVKFRCVWNNPTRYLPLFKRCDSVIGPDFSMYRNMPLVMQQWSCFKSRAISRWLQSEGIEVIPNVRVSDERCLNWVFDGLPKHSVVAMSTHGCCKHKEDRQYLMMGVATAVEALEPETIVVYGSAPEAVFKPAITAGIRIVSFESQFSATHKEGMRYGSR